MRKYSNDRGYTISLFILFDFRHLIENALLIIDQYNTRCYANYN